MDTVSPHTNNNNLPIASGIYKITCTVNKRIYIGSALNFRKRKNDHFSYLRQNKHDNPYLQNAWNKYGEQAFIFEILEIVLPISLTAREQYWFNKLKPFGNKGFNIAREAGSRLGVKASPETIEKLKQSHLGKKQTPEHIEKARQARIGHKVSPEARTKIGQAHLGMKHTDETKTKMKQGSIDKNLGRKHTPEHIEKNRQVWLGRKHTPESIEKIKQAKLGKKLSFEHIEKLKLAKQQRKNQPCREIPDGTRRERVERT